MGRPPRISRQAVVDAAVEVGLDEVSMQAVARRLGVTTPALYSHVAGRAELVALARTALAERLGAVSSDASGWREWLADFAHAVRRDLSGSAASLVGDLRVPGAPVTVGEPGLRLLIAEGLSPAEAARCVWLVFRLALTAGPAPAALAGYVDATGAALDGDDLPATRAVHDALVGDDGDTFSFDLDVVLDGIATRIGAP